MNLSLRYVFKFLTTWVIFLAATPCLASNELNEISSDNDLNSFFVTYYQHPKPELISPAIKYLGSNNLISKNKDIVAPLTSFFSVVFSNNPISRSEWISLIEKQEPQTRTTLLNAIDSSPEQLAEQAKSGMEKNDIYWFAFFASGDTSFVGKILDQLKYLDERKELGLFLTAATAEWSLASNAQSHPIVKAMLESQMRADAGNIQLIAKEILEKGPAKIEAQHRLIINEQRKKGIWK